MNVYYQSYGVAWNWSAILEPFDRSVWIMILIWIIVSTVFVIFMPWVSYKCGLIEETNSVSGDNGFFVLQTLCQQGEYIHFE